MKKNGTVICLLVLLTGIFAAVFRFTPIKASPETFALTAIDGADEVWLSEEELISIRLVDKQALEGNRYIVPLPVGAVYQEIIDKNQDSQILYDKERHQLEIKMNGFETIFQLVIPADMLKPVSLTVEKLSISGEKDTSASLQLLTEPKIEETIDSFPIVDVLEKNQVAANESPQVTTPETTIDYTASQVDGIMDVNSWEGLVTGMNDTSVSVINVTDSFEVPDNPRPSSISNFTLGTTNNVTNSATFVTLNGTGIARKVVIEGNGHTIDFRAVCLRANDNTCTNTDGWDIVWKDLKTYHGNWYGFMTLSILSNGVNGNEAKSKLTFHNIEATGNELLHSPWGQVFMSGTVKNIQEKNYTSPFQSNWQIYNDSQANLEICNLTLLPNTTFEGTTLNSGNIRLYNGGSLVLEEGAEVTLTSGPNAVVGEAYGANVLIDSGNLLLRRDSKLNLNVPPGRLDDRSLHLNSESSKVEIGSRAELNIRAYGHTGAVSLVQLESKAILEVGREGKLDIQSTGMNASNAPIINAVGEAKFIVEKLGIFNIVSDSTSASHYLLNFTSPQAVFEFSDAQYVNLQKLGEISGTNDQNGLINMAPYYSQRGILDVDIQKVNMWNRDNLLDNPSDSWSPMFGVKLRYNNYTTEFESASSLTEEMINRFETDFSTRNVQRVQFEYIPDVDLIIDSRATDNEVDAGSQTVYGITSPNAYVRIQDIPANSSFEPVIDPADNQLISPVTNPGEANPKFTDNFTLQANDQGHYSYTLPEGKYFKSGSELAVYAFKEGKYLELTQTVVDETPPTASAETVYAVKDTPAPNPELFIKNPEDSNPSNQQFYYEYVNREQVEGYMLAAGEYELDVLVKDEAGNATTVKAQLIVREQIASLTADDVTIYKDTLSHFSEDEIKRYILSMGNAAAETISNGRRLELTDQIKVTDLAGLEATSGSGIYQIKLGVSATVENGLSQDLEKEISVFVVNEGPSGPVNPENPVEGSLPPNGSENGGTGNRGTLRLDYIPSVFDFGNVTAAIQDSTYYAQKPKNTSSEELSKQWVQISDDRLTVHGWSLTAEMTRAFSSGDEQLTGAFITLPAGEFYNTRTGAAQVTDGSITGSELEITTSAKTVFSAKADGQAGKKISTKVWNPEEVTIKVNGGTAKPNKEYTTTVNWTLTTTPGS
ncbi:WxL domain-containing protein [Enterococcus sp. LJL51]|uniref:WxL domain-containing protein n=1 Tax=Enterococcus sp. LJL51 TaxID=3416656 RepID=UPI003CF04922